MQSANNPPRRAPISTRNFSTCFTKPISTSRSLYWSVKVSISNIYGIDRALETYLKKGYSPDWVNQRLQTISVRKELTDEWIERGVSKGSEFAILTDEISKAWAGMTTRQYKNHKGLTKENLRDNMSTLELVLNMLAEATTTELSKVEEPETFEQSKGVAQRGGSVAGNAREEIEAQTGRPVVTSKSAQDFRRVLGEVIETAAELGDGRRAEEGPDV